jgi:hypothetical protein
MDGFTRKKYNIYICMVKADAFSAHGYFAH